MKTILQGLLTLLCFTSCMLWSRSETILIFQGLQGKHIDDAAGMNVGHQVLTSLAQKAAPMLVSLDLWNHIIHRHDTCLKESGLRGSLHQNITSLVQDVEHLLAQSTSLDEINIQLSHDWYQKKYHKLHVLDPDMYKKVMFDYFCMQTDKLISGWTVYCLEQSYLLFLPPGAGTVCTRSDMIPLRLAEIMTKNRAIQFKSLATILKKFLVQRDVLWSFYLTGHGHHADSSKVGNMIAGMTVVEFQDMLKLLNDYFRTRILVYSSCYSSGMNLIEPYKKRITDHFQSNLEISMKLNYPVIATCLTDAPVYVFGTPSGLKLPPYDQSFRLEPENVDHQTLTWHFMQDFSKFVQAVEHKKSLQLIAQSVMMYQECTLQGCDLAKLENIPLVRKPGTEFFVPLDTNFVDFIIHDSSAIKVVGNAHGLLWYIKQYHGTICLKHRLAQFICMVPGDGVVWMKQLQAVDFSLADIVEKIFFSIEDLHGVQIYLCDELQCKDLTRSQVTLQKFISIPTSDWISQSFRSGEGGICCFMQNGVAYSCAVSKAGSIEQPVKLDHRQQENFVKLWNFLRKESKVQQELSADKLWDTVAVARRNLEYQKILTSCKQELVCR